MLDHIDQIPFVHNPLHIAAHEGQIHFAMEMMNLKPSFARKLNRDGFSPMHLALRNGQIKLVLRLLKADKDLVRVKGREGITPFHCVVTMGNSNMLIELLEACPKCDEDVTVLNETALHLALKNDQIEAFNLLIGWLQKNCRKGAFALEKNLVNWRDNDDNTMLHIAASKGLHKELQLVLDSFISSNIDVKAKNSQGLTALEIIQNVQRQAVNSAEDDTTTTKIKRLKKKVRHYDKPSMWVTRARNNLSVEMLNATLVVAGLVITAIYQSSISPPGGVWQADNTNSSASHPLYPTSNNTNSSASDPLCPTSNNTNSSASDPLCPTSNNVTLHFIEEKGGDKFIAKHLTGKESRKAGTTILNTLGYLVFWCLNTGAFLFSIHFTVFMLSDVSPVLLTPLYYLGISYFLSMTILAPSTYWSEFNSYTMCSLIFLPGFVMLGVVLRVWKSSNYKEFINLREALRGGSNVGIACHDWI